MKRIIIALALLVAGTAHAADKVNGCTNATCTGDSWLISRNATVQPVDPYKAGLDGAPVRGYASIGTPLTVDTASTTTVTFTGAHNARIGDAIRMLTGTAANIGISFTIVSVPSATSVVIGQKPSTDIAAADTAQLLRPMSLGMSTSGVLMVSPASDTAVFQTLGSIGFATIDGTYRNCIDPNDNTKVVVLDNQTNGDVLVSMDGGATSHFHIKAGDVFTLDLASQGLVTTGIVQVKDGTTASTAGTMYCYAWK